MSRVMFQGVGGDFTSPSRSVRANVILKFRIVQKLWEEKKLWASAHSIMEEYMH